MKRSNPIHFGRNLALIDFVEEFDSKLLKSAAQ
jgi:hypothetical protein